MRQKKKRSFLKRAAAGLLTFLLTVSLIQPYFVSAQEETTVTAESGEEGQDQGNESKPVESEEAAPAAGAGEQNTAASAPAGTSEPAAQISFQAVRNSLEDVEVTLEINGASQEITYPAGLIEDNLDSLNEYLTGNEKFQKAILRKPDGTETEIARIGTYEGRVYYSLSDQQDAGIRLSHGDELVLVCASQYTVTYETGEGGNVTGPETLWNGEGLEATVRAEKYYHIKSVSWSDGVIETPVEINDEDNVQVSIPADVIASDITVKAEFEKDDPYTITAGQIQQGGICLNQGQKGDDYYPDGTDQPIPAVEPGNSQTFMVYSQSWTGGDEYYLNMMKINGENVKVPLTYDVGATSEPSVLSNGSVVTIELVQKNVGLYWKDGDPQYGPLGSFLWWDKERCLYEVTVTDVQEDLSIDLNFKIDSQREMIMTGLEGIDLFGAASEDEWYKWDAPYIGNHYDYSIQENDGDTVYEAYYNDGIIDGDAYNIYLYTVKPGYNPNTVDFEVFYNGVQMASEQAISPKRDGSGEEAWMLTVEEMAAALNTNFRHFDDFVEAANAAGYTYCFALNQNSAYNQLLRLKASPYQYHTVFELDGGTYDGTDLDMSQYQIEENGTVTERDENGSLKIYTLENGSASFNMPLVKPVKDGSIFTGWKLYKDGKPVDDTIYSANQAFLIDETSIAYAKGDEEKDEGHTFTFVAQWENVVESPETAAYSLEYYVEDPVGDIEENGTTYRLYYSSSDYGDVGSEIFALNDRNPDPEKYELNEASKIRIDRLMDEMAEGWEENNKIVFYYDLSTYTLTVGKDVQEDGDLTRAYEIQISLKDVEGNPVSGTYGDVTFENGSAVIELKDGENVELTDIPSGYQYSVKEIESLPNGYTTTYQTGDDEPSDQAPSDVALEGDTTVTVINSRTVTPDSGIVLGGTAAGAGIGLAAVGAAVVFFLRRRKNA